MADTHPGVRTLRVSAKGMFEMLQGLSTAQVRGVSDVLPNGCALSGSPRWDAGTQTLEIDVQYHAWPNDRGDTIDLLWARQLSPRDWGPAVSTDPPPSPPRG